MKIQAISEALKVKSTELTEWAQELTFAQIWSDVPELKGLEFNSVKEGKDFILDFFKKNPSVKTNETKVVSSAVKKDGKTAIAGDGQVTLGHTVFKSGAKGFVKMTTFRKDGSTEIDGTPNLVLLSGREFLAQKLSDVYLGNSNNYLDYKIRYFGYGRGGAQEGTGTVPNKKGPFDDDTGLYGVANFSTGATDADTEFKYITNGKLKRILADDGRITIEQENHIINKGSVSAGTSVSSSTEITVPRFTAIKYTMYIMSHEFIKPSTAGAVDENPFPFNEAALYAVRMQDVTNSDGIGKMEQPYGTNVIEQQNPDYIPFARFTTSTKWIEEGESLKIEWYILV